MLYIVFVDGPVFSPQTFIHNKKKFVTFVDSFKFLKKDNKIISNGSVS